MFLIRIFASGGISSSSELYNENTLESLSKFNRTSNFNYVINKVILAHNK